MIYIYTLLLVANVLSWLLSGHWLIAIIFAVISYFWLRDAFNGTSEFLNFFTRLKDKFKS